MPSPRAYVYIVRCRDGTLYIGTARDVATRLAQHDAGKGAKYTRSRGPLTLLWSEGPMTVSRALRREHQLKQLTRAQKEAFVAGTLVVILKRRSKSRRKPHRL
ncbi:MAG TPA: GIY-YIG nuclease family protein [Lacunisphaera sp.]|nr:GIY-YIG nuclease family protein [Lacunisphaera sp.]